MKTSKLFVVAAAFALMITLGFGMAQAAPLPPVTTDPTNIYAPGTKWGTVFLFADAGDTSELYELYTNGGAGTGLIFRNNDLGSYPIGMRKDYTSITGEYLEFVLKDTSVAAEWHTGAASTNAAYWDYDGNPSNLESYYGITLSTDAKNALAQLVADYNDGALIIGFEDRALDSSDKDFNDLIFAFSPLKAEQVPEPATMLLLGLGLVGMGVASRRKFKK